MNITISYQPSEIKLKELFTNIVDARFRIDCRDLEQGHEYYGGECQRCYHDINPDEDYSDED